MKRIIMIAFVAMSFIANAQTKEEGIQMYKYDRFESAKKILEPLSVKDAMANYYLGLSELALEKTNEAKAIFQKYPEDNANNAGLARIYFIEKKPQDAMAILQKVAAKAKKKDYNPLRLAADAITYTEGGDPNVAIDWYKKAMLVERTGDLHIGLGDAFRKIQGGGGDAMTNYEYAETFENTKSISNQKMGNLWYAAKVYDSALTKYARASELDSKNPLPYKSLADAYYRIKKYKISKENIEKYLELSDKTADDQMQYANTLYLAKEYQPAVTKMQELITNGIEKPYMYRVIGYSLFELKDYKGAVENMDKLFAKQDPAKIIPQDYMYYGKLLLKDSVKAAQADSYFEKGFAADTTTDKTPLYRELAENLQKDEKYLAAAKWYSKIIESNSPSTEILDYWWTGACYFYAKDYVTADSKYKEMAAKFPTEPSSVFMLARTAFYAKDKTYTNGAASEYYKQYLAMVNDDITKKTELIKAYTYLSTVSYNLKNKADASKYVAKLVEIDPANETAKQLIALIPKMK